MTQLGGQPLAILGVSGGIAAYKSAQVLRGLTEHGIDVRVVATHSALNFVGEATFAGLSGHQVYSDISADIKLVPHISLGRQADLVVVAPATANLIAKAATGLADDVLTATLLTARCPILLVPAMHTEMWEHPATQHNVAVLRSRGVIVLEPASGRLAGPDIGKGRLPEPTEIIAFARLLLDRPTALPRDLVGKRVLVSAGGTREPLDPVRFIGNRSSGRQGFAIAQVAAARGAEVVVVAANNAPDLAPSGMEVISVNTAQQLHEQMLRRQPDADVIIMAAAVADFRPIAEYQHKLKKDHTDMTISIELTRNPDILTELVVAKQDDQVPRHQVIVGFAAETGDDAHSPLEYGIAKLAHKKCDWLVVNEVGHDKGFEQPDNAGWLLSRSGVRIELPATSKMELASTMWDVLVARSLGLPIDG